MIKRTVEVSAAAAHLTVRQAQLLILHGEETAGRVPCEDIGVVLVDHPGTTYSHAALVSLVEAAAVLVVCGHNHLPVGMLVPMGDHSEVVWRLQDQLEASKPVRKQLWRQLVRAKIRAQAANLPDPSPARSKLLDLAQSVRSGDPRNVEAHAARVYWEHWLPGEVFRRDTSGGKLNGVLNYGYAVLRAAVARALVAAGLLPALGLFHTQRGNAFCLADDLMEPLRPLVDRRARSLYQEGCCEMNHAVKARLLEVLTESVRLVGERGPLMVAVHRMVASLVRCFEGSAKRLEIPTGCS